MNQVLPDKARREPPHKGLEEAPGLLEELWQPALVFAVGAFYLISRMSPIMGLLLMVGGVWYGATKYLNSDRLPIDRDLIDEMFRIVERRKKDPVEGDKQMAYFVSDWPPPDPHLERIRNRIKRMTSFIHLPRRKGASR